MRASHLWHRSCLSALGPEGNVIALIDYDNLDVRQRRLGVRHVMARLLQVLGRRRLAGERNVECRLYGGWFDEASLSPAARQLLPEVQREFPSSMAVAGRDGQHVLLVRAELARALICDPGVELTHTYRRRSLPPRLRCVAAPFPSCAEPSRCPIANVEPFIRDGACPADGCEVMPGAVLERAEQKLVGAGSVSPSDDREVHAGRNIGDVHAVR